MEQQRLPNSTLILILGILSILGCCFYGIGIIIGIVALVLASKATTLYNENPDEYTGYQNVKTGKILSIIGIILCVLSIAITLYFGYKLGWDAMGNQELMQERMQEMMGQ